nr:LytTR family DNA-binding domain-containing protein [Maliibacterium massiliense]
MAIGCIVADDQADMRRLVCRVLEKTEGFTLLAEAQNGAEALRLFEEKRPDVLFLDVEMPDITGIEVARQVQDIAPKTSVVFITAHEVYRKEAFEVYAVDYLVKPFELERLRGTLARILEWNKQHEAVLQAPVTPRPRTLEKIMLKGREGVTVLDLNDILLIQREDRQTVFYTVGGGRCTSSDTLSELENRLPHDRFFRTHKSYIINLDYISNIYPYGRWTYIVKLKGTTQDALMTHDRYDQLEAMMH